MSVDAQIRRIRTFVRDQGLTKGRMAVRAGLRDTVLRKLDADDWNPTAETLRRLESVIPADWQEPTETGEARAELVTALLTGKLPNTSSAGPTKDRTSDAAAT